MSCYSSYEGYKPLYYESDSDNVPMISRERYASPESYHDNRTQLYPSRSWNEEPLVTQEIGQPEMSNLGRLLVEAIEQTERQSREFDEIFDWNFEPYHEKPYDTFTNAIGQLDDVEAIGYNDYYSNVDVVCSSNFVFQDDSEDEMNEEEENYEYTNYPHEISQVVLQELHKLEPELKEHSDFENSDFEDSNEEEFEIEEEILVEEVVEISVTPILEIVSVSFESNAVNEELENEVEIIKNKLEEASITAQNDKHVDVLENQVSQKLDYPDLEEELYELLGLKNGELQELMNNGDGMMTETELLESMGFEVDESHSLDKEGESIQHEDDMMCIKGSLEVSLLDFAPTSSKCECEFALVKEPKPPDFANLVPKGLALLIDVDELKVGLDRGIWCNWVSNKYIATHIGSDIYGLLDDPGELEMGIACSLGIAYGENLKIYCCIIWLNRHPENEWRIYTLVWEGFYMNRKTKDNFLPTEYDWKGVGVVINDPP